MVRTSRGNLDAGPLDNYTAADWCGELHDAPPRAITGHADWVRSVAVGQLDGRTIIVSGSDQTLQIRDTYPHSHEGFTR